MPGPTVLGPGEARSEQCSSACQLQTVCTAHTPRNSAGALRLHQLWLQCLGRGFLARLLLHFYPGPI